MGNVIAAAPSAPTTDRQPEGIGGWLVLPAIWLVLGPIGLVWGIFSTAALAPMLAELLKHDPMKDGKFLAIMVLDGILALFTASVAFLFFRRSSWTRPFFQALLVTNLVAIAVEATLTADVMSIEISDAIPVRNAVQAAIAAAFFIPYMAISKRAKNTFTR